MRKLNLQKLKNGEQLIEVKGVLPPPGYEKQALTSEEYFNKMYAVNNEFNFSMCNLCSKKLNFKI